MIFNMDLDYGRKPKEVEALPNTDLSVDYCSFAVRQYYKDGLDNQFRRTWARIQRKFDVLLDDHKVKKIELEHTELDFIRAAFKAAKFSSDLAKYVVVIEEALDKAKEKANELPPKAKA